MSVTTEGLKAQLNLDHSEDDLLLSRQIASAKGWISGYIDADFPEDDTPAALVEACYQLAAHFYEQRGEDAEAGIPASVRSLCSPHIVWSF